MASPIPPPAPRPSAAPWALALGLAAIISVSLGAGAVWVRAARAAAALPVGQVMSDVVLTDLSDRPVPLGALAGRAVALLHEDRDTKDDENQALKDALGLATERHGARLRLIAVADVSPYNFWPARHYAIQAMRKVSGQGVELLADWTGALRRRLGLRGSGQSTLIVIGPDGRVAILARGPHTPREVAATMARIDQIVQIVQPAPPARPAH